MARNTYATYGRNQNQPIPQSEPARSDQVRNNAGGYTFGLDMWKRLERFLIIGSDSPTYYVNAKTLTRDNARVVSECLAEDPDRTIATIVTISDSGRAPRNDAALFALALAASDPNVRARRLALEALPQVARIPTHLFDFLTYVQSLRGWGRSLRNAVASWYNDRDASTLSYHAVKYQARNGWSNRDVLRKAHPRPATDAHNSIYKWIIDGDLDAPSDDATSFLAPIYGFEQAKCVTTESEIVSLIHTHGLTREMLPTQWLNSIAVWEALLDKMPLNAMVRNLGKMTAIGLLAPLSNAATLVATRLGSTDYIRKSRLHPLAILNALRVYARGHGDKGSLSWNPNTLIHDALDGAFYKAFAAVEPTNKRHLLALDISGSMSWSTLSNMSLTPREASAAMALVTAAVEPQTACVAFCEQLKPFDISPLERLNTVVDRTSRLHMGGTDCALPMLYAIQHNLTVDAFVIYTDNETWFGAVHPYKALEQYRQASGINAKLIVVAMTSSGFSIADQSDLGSLDVVGFSTDTPAVISNFVRD